MARLCDSIEQFIKELMEDGSLIELRRNELAQHFGCAPSQINYVLSTRFTIERGYIIDSRRGEGGYVRIVQMRAADEGEQLLSGLLERVGKAVSEEGARGMVHRLLHMSLVTQGEANLMAAAVADEALAIPISAKDVLRASVLRAMLIQVFRNREGAKNHDV